MRRIAFYLLLVMAWGTVLRASETPAITIYPGQPAPPLAVGKWLKGEPVKAFEPGKIYVVEFWATWCGPCKEAIPHVSALQQQYKDKGVIFVGLDIWEQDPSGAALFVAQMGDKMNYRVAADDKTGTIAATWMTAAGQNAIPCSFLIDPQGKIAWIGHPLELAPVLAKVVNRTYDPLMELGAHPMQLARASSNYDEELRLVNQADKSATGLQWTEKWRFDALWNKGDATDANALAEKIWQDPRSSLELLHDVLAIMVADDSQKLNLPLKDKLLTRAEQMVKASHSPDEYLSLDLTTMRYDLSSAEGNLPGKWQAATALLTEPMAEPDLLQRTGWDVVHGSVPPARPNFALAEKLYARAASLTDDKNEKLTIQCYRLYSALAQNDSASADKLINEIAASPDMQIETLVTLGFYILPDYPTTIEQLMSVAAKNAKDAVALEQVHQAHFDVLLKRNEYGRAYSLAQTMLDSKDASGEVLANMAERIDWFPGVERRDFKLAEKLASRANDLTHGSHPLIIDDYAEVAFEAGEYDKALSLEKLGLQHGAQQSKFDLTMLSFDLRLGRFGDALVVCSKIRDQNPTQAWYWRQVGAIQLYLGDVNAYKATCEAMQKRFATTSNADEAEWTSILCLLMPSEVHDTKTLWRLVDLALTSPQRNSPGREFMLLKGIALYRAGDFAGAIAWLKRYPSTDPNDPSDTVVPAIHTSATFYIAMAEHRLKYDALAQAYLKSAQRNFITKVPPVQTHNYEVGDIPWIIAKLAAKEAQADLNSPAADISNQAP